MCLKTFSGISLHGRVKFLLALELGVKKIKHIFRMTFILTFSAKMIFLRTLRKLHFLKSKVIVWAG